MVPIAINSFQALPFGQSFLSAAVRIGSLAVRMAAFSCAWVWRSERGGLQGQCFDVGRWQAPYFGNLVTQQKHYRRCSWSPHALCRKAERIALDFCSIRSIVTAH